MKLSPIILAVSTLVCRTSEAAPGELDPTFGSGGKLVHSLASVGTASVADVVVQPDGKIIVGGTLTHAAPSGGRDFALWRFNSNGSPDTTFGASGYVTASMDASNSDSFGAMALQPDGKIVVAGSSQAGQTSAFALLRFLPDGVLDDSFSEDGTALFPIPSSSSVAQAVAIQKDGKIVLSGVSASSGTSVARFAIMRSKPDGSLDTAFGNSGFGGSGGVVSDFGISANAATFPGLVIQASGDIVAVGWGYKVGTIFRGVIANIKSAGGFNSSFGSGGFVIVDNYPAVDVVLQSDGKIVTGGQSILVNGPDFTLMRHLTTGAKDMSFNGTGSITTPLGDQAAEIESLVVQTDGKIVAFGEARFTAGVDFALTRSSAAGVLDSSFGSGGKVVTDVAGTQDLAGSMAMQQDGRMVCVGHVSGGAALLLVRYQGDPAEISVYNGAVAPANELQDNSGTLEMGDAVLGTGLSRVITIKNSGPGPLANFAVSVAGTNPGDVTVDTTGMATQLKKDATTTFKVTFNPTAVGPRSAVIQLASSDDDENPFRITVAGTGITTDIALDRDNQQQREDVATITLPVRLSAAAGGAFTVPLEFGGSATIGIDYTRTPASLSFSATQTTANITLVVKDDLLVEGDETVTVTLGGPSIPGVVRIAPQVFTLTIVEDDVLPVIAPDLVSQIVSVGDAVTFASGVTGSAPLTLKWKKGSATLLGETGTSLVLPPATLSTAAAYTFSAGNQRGGDSSTAELAVVDRSAAVVRANAGSSPKLSVAAKGNRLSYQWRDASGDLSPSNPKYAGVTSATLTIKNATAADSGLYTCRVTAPGGTLDSGDRFLQVPSLKPIANAPALPDVVIHNAFSHQLTFDPEATRAPTKFLCTGLPKGLRCDPASGLISGKPTETGDFTVTVTLSNAADTADTVQDTFSVLAYPAGAVGKYVGVIGRNSKANADLGGRIDFTTTPLGSYTGTLKLGSSTLKLQGTLTTPATMGGHPGATLTLARSRQLPVILKLDLDPVTNDLTGSVYEHGETGSDNLIGWRNTWTSAAPTQQGAHSFKIDPAATGPQGYGFGSIAVSATGVTTLKGQTSDGGVVTSSGLLGPDGEVLVFAPMLGNKASLLGTLGIGSDHSINSSLSWQKTAATKPREYAPFGPLTVTVTGGLYLAENPVLGLTDTGVDNAELLFSEAGVPSSTNPNVAVYINNANKPTLSATNPGSVKLTSFNASTGAFTGQFTLKDAPAAPRTVKFQGQLVPTESRGYGYFLLPQLANPPTTTASTSPILSGQVVLE